MKLSSWIRGAVLAVAMAPVMAFASDYPTRPVKLVIPYAPGGPTDVFGRIVAEELGRRLTQPVVVENKPGGGGAVAMTQVARAPTDGHTLLFGDINLAVGKLVNPDLRVDVTKDLAAVGFAGVAPMLLLTGAAEPAHDAKAFVDAARKAPGKYTYGSGGHGSPTHLGPELLKDRQGLDILMVTYQGSGPALTALAAGEVNMMMTGLSAARPLLEAKRIKALGILGPVRSTRLPDLPTLKEQGLDLPEMDTGSWWGVMAPAGTPQAVVDQLNAALAAMLDDPQMLQRIGKLNIEPRKSTPAEFSAFIAAQRTVWTNVLAPVK